MTTPHRLPTAAFIYYAEPMDRAAGPGRAGYQIVRALADLGFTCYRPATTWTGGAFNPQLVEQLNREALYQANAVIADASTGAPSVGVWMEIEAATSRGIPAVVLVDPNRPRSVSLQASPLVAFAETWGDAVTLANKAAQTHWAHNGRKVESNTLKFVMADGCQPPKQGLADDAGVDLTTAVDTEIPPHTFVDIPSTVLGVQVPEGTWALITGRSSAIRKRGLLVPNGVIDHGWRGPLMAGVYNLTDQPVMVLAGERVAQVILMPNTTEQAEIVKVDKLDPHQRGLAGFGSTGGTGNDGVVGQMAVLTPANPALYEWSELESLRETVAILSDPDAMAALREAEADIEAGRLTELAVTTAAPADFSPYRWDGSATPAELPWASEGERLQALNQGWAEADAGKLSEHEARQLENATSDTQTA